jgi:predicted dehydrogenase
MRNTRKINPSTNPGLKADVRSGLRFDKLTVPSKVEGILSGPPKVGRRSINVAIIGIGHLGARHLKVYSELKDKVNIAGICDIKVHRTQRLADHYKVKFFKDYRDLPPEVEAVNICTPTVTHFEIAKHFLENGVHTFVEKPMTLNVEQADRLIELAEGNNLKLQVGHVERFNAAFQSIKHFTTHPLFIECHRLNRFPNRSLDIGVVMDLMIHDIDIILGLVAAPLKDIQAVGINVLTPLDDIASVRLTFENGCVCNLTASRVSEDVMRKIRIFQKNSYISLDYVKQEAYIYKKHYKLIFKHALPIEKEEPLKKELESFIDCVRENQSPVVSGREGREALKVVLQISEKISEIQKLYLTGVLKKKSFADSYK